MFPQRQNRLSFSFLWGPCKVIKYKSHSITREQGQNAKCRTLPLQPAHLALPSCLNSISLPLRFVEHSYFPTGFLRVWDESEKGRAISDNTNPHLFPVERAGANLTERQVNAKAVSWLMMFNCLPFKQLVKEKQCYTLCTDKVCTGIEKS